MFFGSFFKKERLALRHNRKHLTAAVSGAGAAAMRTAAGSGAVERPAGAEHERGHRVGAILAVEL